MTCRCPPWLPKFLIVLIVGIVVLNLAGQAISVTNQLLIVEIDPTPAVSSSVVTRSTTPSARVVGAIAATIVYSALGWSAVCVPGFTSVQ